MKVQNNITLLPVQKKKSGMATMHRQNRIFLICMLTLPIIHWIIFWLYKNLSSFVLAFTLPTGEFTLYNFQYFFKQFSLPHNVFFEALKNTALWFGQDLLLIFPFTIVLNYFFYKKMFGYKQFRILLWVSGMVSSVVMAAMIQRFILPSGPLGVLLKSMGMEEVPLFLADSRYAQGTMMIYMFWRSWGQNMLLFGGMYARIPDEVLESAKLDGCGPIREIVQLIVPMISAQLITLIILKLTGLLQSSGPVILFTEGKYETQTLAYWIWDSVRNGGQYNTVSAVGLVATAVSVPVILGLRKLLEKIPVVEM